MVKVYKLWIKPSTSGWMCTNTHTYKETAQQYINIPKMFKFSEYNVFEEQIECMISTQFLK